jgi:hypothetical protein
MDLQGKHIQVFAKVISHVNTIRKSVKTNRITDRIFFIGNFTDGYNFISNFIGIYCLMV